jgi:hypothetical protein
MPLNMSSKSIDLTFMQDLEDGDREDSDGEAERLGNDNRALQQRLFESEERVPLMPKFIRSKTDHRVKSARHMAQKKRPGRLEICPRGERDR